MSAFLTVGDLFSGIGGFALGLERAGMYTRWFAEVDPYASAVLRKHWPDIPNHGNVRSIRGNSVERVDVLCGGFPCQDISNAGQRAGIDGERSGLWSEYARIVGELRPRYVIVENVAALLGRGLERVLGDLAALGYDAEWHCIPASAVGAPHGRDRVWIVAYPDRSGWQARDRDVSPSRHGDTVAAGDSDVGNAGCKRRQQVTGCARGDEATHEGWPTQHNHEPASAGKGMGHPDEPRLQGLGQLLERARQRSPWSRGEVVVGYDGTARLVEPGIPPLAHGVPARVQRLRTTGNAIVPQIAEVIGRAIMAAEQYEAA
jgi:DNA (cytosine-5)-methyltransferase 1